jgi:tetraacyldisaccharide 4'-kinase
MFGSIYGKLADVRNTLYERGVFERFYLGARTISVGNITAGGTGKTPLVAYVAEILAARGEKVCILTRGYKRADEKRRVLVSDGEQVHADFREAGDEPVELAQKLLGKAIVIADADRVAAAEWAKRKFGITAFVLDDGFQHRRAKRDVDIVCIDATDPFGGGKMLPSGRLREPLHNLGRADIVIITRTNLEGVDSNLPQEIAKYCAPERVFLSRPVTTNVKEMTDGTDLARQTPVYAFCGLGNPDAFFEQLHQDGYDPAHSREFPDHHIYSQVEIDEMANDAPSYHAEALVTTAKDAVKLAGLKFRMPCYVAEIELHLDDPAAFADLL